MSYPYSTQGKIKTGKIIKTHRNEVFFGLPTRFPKSYRFFFIWLCIFFFFVRLIFC